jgi:hypothetical protein
MCETCIENEETRAPEAGGSRRLFLLLGLAALIGCSQQTVYSPTPSPPWPAHPPSRPAVNQRATAIPGPQVPASPQWGQHVIARSAWAKGQPMPLRMNRMSPIRHITVHHDGMDPFFETDQSSVSAHLEGIRQLHQRKGWGDIGYHFAVDRAGRIWECRSMGWQGAHVKDHNPGNIGIVVLGNFEQQAPSDAQLAGVRQHVTMLMRVYNVPKSRVHTHQEWQGAKTACPGANLQHSLEQMRVTGGFG